MSIVGAAKQGPLGGTQLFSPLCPSLQSLALEWLPLPTPSFPSGATARPAPNAFRQRRCKRLQQFAAVCSGLQ
eukprot:7234711-Alexandrium_andersonii.AAC.1